MNREALFVFVIIPNVYPKVGPLTRIIYKDSEIEQELDNLFNNEIHTDKWRWFIRRVY